MKFNWKAGLKCGAIAYVIVASAEYYSNRVLAQMERRFESLDTNEMKTIQEFLDTDEFLNLVTSSDPIITRVLVHARRQPTGFSDVIWETDDDDSGRFGMVETVESWATTNPFDEFIGLTVDQAKTMFDQRYQVGA